ncbi:hypothetical protein MGYG_04155 [Nannizzia gypsea CBS 118893]|uniref:Serine/arginine repetitive matrix protein 1 n=1 Tax=Arthroderma gypseum (strain ATCC MYA-4604 / CBS 118893) TaxID=535722 RepID=E4UV34_ARTGP|nr:hypothetical protein MGYG_04155 [Nannizzia gypsea CBS 118893]EFR01151.1 hypothetical protein MGYG_04155 [Nannizzia gypsea CBS 118893]
MDRDRSLMEYLAYGYLYYVHGADTYIRFDDSRRGGESYRPLERNFRRSPRPDNRSFRSPPRNRSPMRSSADTWAPPSRPRPRSRSPGNFRPRSRSPLFRGRERGPNFGNRPRSPFRRPSPSRDRPPRFNRRSRSPPPFDRNRSPSLRRGRDPSPSAINAPRAPKRERNNSPPRNRFERPRSPPFNEITQQRDPRMNGRRRSRSADRRSSRGDPTGARGPPPPPPPRSPSITERSGPNSAHGSAATSRRSSPPAPERMNRNYSTPSGHGPPSISRPQYDSSHPYTSAPRFSEGNRRPSSRPASPSRRPSTNHQLQSPRSNEPQRPFVDNEYDRNQNPSGRPSMGPRTESNLSIQSQSANAPEGRSPPLGPSAASRSMRQPARGGHMALLSAPTRPKGASGAVFNRDGPPTGPREAGRPGPNSGPSMVRRGSSHAPAAQHHAHPPSGPRGAGGSPAPGVAHDSRPRPPFRHGSGVSTNYPRAPRPTNHLAGLSSIIPGGKLLPSGLDSITEKRLAQLEADKEKLLDQISEKQRAKRACLREWEKLCRESETAALRTDLADSHLQRMSETEGIGGGVAF